MPGRLQHIFFFLIVIITSLTIFTITSRVVPFQPCACTIDHYEAGSIVWNLFQEKYVVPNIHVTCKETEYCPNGHYLFPVDLLLLDFIVIAGFGIVVIKRRKTIIEQEFKRK